LEKCVHGVRALRRPGGQSILIGFSVRNDSLTVVSQHESMGRWQLVSAMQALAIYILVRLNEGEQEYNNLDTVIVQTMNVSDICYARIRPAHAWHGGSAVSTHASLYRS
jgi:hypothetical protein